MDQCTTVAFDDTNLKSYLRNIELDALYIEVALGSVISRLPVIDPTWLYHTFILPACGQLDWHRLFPQVFVPVEKEVCTVSTVAARYRTSDPTGQASVDIPYSEGDAFPVGQKKNQSTCMVLFWCVSIAYVAFSDDTTVKALKEAETILGVLCGCEEYLIWSHLIYDKPLSRFLNSILVYLRRPYEVEHAVHSSTEPSRVFTEHATQRDEASITSHDPYIDKLVALLVQYSISLLTRSPKRFRDIVTYRKLLSCVVVNLDDFLHTLCNLSTANVLTTPITTLATIVLSIHPSPLEAISSIIKTACTALRCPIGSIVTHFESPMHINFLLRQIASVIDVCAVVQDSNFDCNLPKDVTYMFPISLRRSNAHEPLTVECSSGHHHTSVGHKASLCAQEFHETVVTFLGNALQFYATCCSHSNTFRCNSIPWRRIRRLLLVSVFRVLTLSGEATEPDHNNGFFQWVLSLLETVENTKDAMQKVLQEDWIQCGAQMDWRYSESKAKQGMNFSLCEYFFRFVLNQDVPQDAFPHGLSEEYKIVGASSDTVQCPPLSPLEEEALVKIKSLFESDLPWSEDRIIACLRSCSLCVDKTLDRLLNDTDLGHGYSCDALRPGSDQHSKASTQPLSTHCIEEMCGSTRIKDSRSWFEHHASEPTIDIEQQEDQQLKEVTLQLVKKQNIESVRNTMREGKRLVMDDKFKREIQSVFNLSSDDEGQFKKEYKLKYGEVNYVDDDDESDNEFLDLSCPTPLYGERQDQSDSPMKAVGFAGPLHQKNPTTHSNPCPTPYQNHFKNHRRRDRRNAKINRGMLPVFNT